MANKCERTWFKANECKILLETASGYHEPEGDLEDLESSIRCYLASTMSANHQVLYLRSESLLYHVARVKKARMMAVL